MGIKYIDINFEYGGFRVIRTGNKPRGGALETLERIEKIVSTSMTYSEYDPNPNFEKLSNEELWEKLADEAKRIKEGYDKKVVQSSFLSRFFGLRQRQRVDETYTRIEQQVYAPIYRLPAEVIQQICSDVPIKDFDPIAKTMGREVTKRAVILRARKYGYEGNNYGKAKQHLLSVFNRAFIEKGVIPRKYVVLRKRKWRSRYDMEATFQKFLKVPKNQRKKVINFSLLKQFKTEREHQIFGITFLLVLGADPNEVIHEFVRKGLLEQTQLLLKWGANPNLFDKDGKTPLHIAAEKGHIDICLLLLEKGAKINVVDYKGRPPLTLAIKNRRKEMVSLLLNMGADPNLNRFLIRASVKGELEICQLLVEHGARVNAQNDLGNTALHIAAAYGKVEIVKYLISKKVNINVQNHEGQTPLHLAAKYNQNSILIELLRKGADTSIRSKEKGETALHLAEKYMTVSLLIELGGADFEVRDNYNFTPLKNAISKDKSLIVLYLLEKGANPNIEESFNKSPLNMAALKGSRKICEYLLDYGADINKECNGLTPLKCALQGKHKELVKYLFKKGARLEA